MTAAPESPRPQLKALLTPTLFTNIRRVWFAHISDAEHIFVPSLEDALHWFTRNEEFDGAPSCRAEFGSTLAALEGLTFDGSDMIAAAELTSPLDWMSLIILLDQITRNCFRDDEAGKAYGFFDERCLQLALEAIERRIPEDPEIRYRQAYRFWFYMPLEHSESMQMQDMLFSEHRRMFSDTLCVLFGLKTELGEDMQVVLSTKEVLERRRPALEPWIGTLSRIVTEHRNVLERFGRYPHRNQALKRTSTAAEVAHLEIRG
ncbi:hypothetical protein ACHAP9_002103 [Verticillium nonalfalfae]